MHPILLHILLLVLLAVPIVYTGLSGQPGHQATAAAWAVGLLFCAGLWLGQLILSSGLLIWRYRVKKPNCLTVIGLHVASVITIVILFYLTVLVID